MDVAAEQQAIDLAAMNRLIGEAKAMGNVFFGIVGGEPFMHPELLDMLAEHPDCYFQIFTNGQFITDDDRQRTAPPRQRDAADQRRRATRSSATSVAAGTKCFNKTMAGTAKLPRQQAVHRRLHQPVPDQHRRLCSTKPGSIA